MLKTANSDGYVNQEVKILEAVQNGFKGYDLKSSQTASAAFFRTNDKKLNALIKATVSDLKRAETAILRMSNDKYRKAIFNAQIFANTGAAHMKKRSIWRVATCSAQGSTVWSTKTARGIR